MSQGCNVMVKLSTALSSFPSNRPKVSNPAVTASRLGQQQLLSLRITGHSELMILVILPSPTLGPAQENPQNLIARD